ncbi:MAG: hypothetical protein AAFQ89_05100 [Cyanobacteria bacterium J06626_18]
MASINLAELLHKKAAEVAPSAVEQKMNAHEAVRQCLVEIRGCRKRKLSWEAIAELVKSVVLEGYGVELSLTGETTKHYYYTLTRKKRSNRRSTPHKPAPQARQPSAQPSATVIPLPEKPKAVEPKEAEPIEVPTSVAPAEEAVVQEEISPEELQDESTAATGVQGSQQPEEPAQSDPYRRPPGSRFTKGHKVKYWNGGTS